MRPRSAATVTIRRSWRPPGLGFNAYEVAIHEVINETRRPHTSSRTSRRRPRRSTSSFATPDADPAEAVGLDGWKGMIGLVNETAGKANPVALWESQEALQASEQAGDDLRRRSASHVSGEIGQVGRYDVPMMSTGRRSSSAAAAFMSRGRDSNPTLWWTELTGVRLCAGLAGSVDTSARGRDGGRGLRSQPGGGRAADSCGLPSTAPVWIDYAEGSVAPDVRAVFARPGVVVTASGTAIPKYFRDHGAATTYFVLHLPASSDSRPTRPIPHRSPPPPTRSTRGRPSPPRARRR